MSENRAADAQSASQTNVDAADAWPLLPTETEIYLLPTGEVVVADLPAELATLMAQLANEGAPEAILSPGILPDTSD